MAAASGAWAQASSPDSFAAALADRGLELRDLSRTSPPDWLGRPAPATVPFVLPHHRHVQDDPRHLLRLGSNLLTVAEQVAAIGEPDLVKPGLDRLFTVFTLQPRLPGFRGVAPPQPAAPSLDAALRLAGAEGDGERRASELPEALRQPLARLVLAAATAATRVEASWAGVEGAVLREALALRDVPRLLPGGSAPWPALYRLVADGRVPGDVDRAGAAVGLVHAAELVSAELAELAELDPGGVGLPEPWQVATRWGRVVVTGPGDDEMACDDCLVLVDLGGDDVWSRDEPRGGRPASLVLDLSGDDTYRGRFASGRGGVAVVFDAAGGDRYLSADDALGYGFLGYGVLFDASGNDRYTSGGGAQGSAVFGGGLLVDGGGDDRYEIDGEGQGFGGPSAGGALIDLGGDDAYRAVPDPANAPGRADYHSEGEVNASNAQGAGVGRRGDLTDGHLWAGGVGALVDVAGNDRYEAGNFAQASGYAYGTGFLLDGGGDDVFRATYFSQGSASHEAAALLFDTAGSDHHELATGAGLGYGWDFAIGLLADLGGDDRYRARKLALGSSDLSSLGLFLDVAGADVYEAGEDGSDAAGVRLLGASGGDPRASDGPPHHAAESVRDLGLFFDLGGVDVYPAVRGGEPAEGSAWEGPGGGLGLDADLGLDAEPVLGTTFWTWLDRRPRDSP